MKQKNRNPKAAIFSFLRIQRILREPNYSAENLQTKLRSP